MSVHNSITGVGEVVCALVGVEGSSALTAAQKALIVRVAALRKSAARLT